VDLAIVITVVVVALFFDYTNGFHDAANAIATSVSTRALTPRVALILAAVMNFVGAFLGQKVAQTVSDVIVPPSGTEGLIVIFAGLLGAIIWNLITWYFGLPSSSTQALIGGLVGAALAAGTTVHWSTVVDKVVIPMLVSPLVGFALAFAVMLAILWIFRHRNAGRVTRGFRLAQTVSASAMALGHGLQDAQKTMGVIFLVLITSGHVVRGRDLAGHLLRRLADHAHPRPPDHPPRPATRLRGRVGRRDRALRVGVPLPGAGLDHPRDHLGHHGLRCHPPLLGRPVGHGPLDRDRLGVDLPHGGHRRGPLLRGPQPPPQLTPLLPPSRDSP
jgi:phosphate/sulfate permease